MASEMWEAITELGFGRGPSHFFRGGHNYYIVIHDIGTQSWLCHIRIYYENGGVTEFTCKIRSATAMHGLITFLDNIEEVKPR